MRNLKRNAAVVGASAIIAALGVGGVMSAPANNAHAPSHSQVQKSAGDEAAAKEPRRAYGPDVGPYANPNEPGHQDANEKGENAGESESATDDGPNVGPDANPNEPGHQDADESGDAAGK
jgi:hypothetical protein